LKELDFYFGIDENGKVTHETKEWREKLIAFANKNRGKKGIVTYRVSDTDAEIWQHKYYRGYLLPPIAKECFGDDLLSAHDALKEKFLFYKLNNENDIQARFRRRCNKYYYQKNDAESTGRVFVGITPSTGDLTAEEFNEFLKKVELFGIEYANLKLDETGNAIRMFAATEVKDEQIPLW
jgi:hypothetical protein